MTWNIRVFHVINVKDLFGHYCFVFLTKENLWDGVSFRATELAFRGFPQSNKFAEKSFKLVDAHSDLFKIENLEFIVCNELSFEKSKLL